MNYNHEAIRAAYPDKNLLICDDIGIFDRDISDTTPFEVDQALVDAAAVTTDLFRVNLGGSVQIGGAIHSNTTDMDVANTKLTIKQTGNSHGR